MPILSPTNVSGHHEDQPGPVGRDIFIIAGIAFALEFVIRRAETAFVPWAGRE